MPPFAKTTHDNHIITSIYQNDHPNQFTVTITDPNNDQIAIFTTGPAIKTHTAALETGKRVLTSFFKPEPV